MRHSYQGSRYLDNATRKNANLGPIFPINFNQMRLEINANERDNILSIISCQHLKVDLQCIFYLVLLQTRFKQCAASQYT